MQKQTREQWCMETNITNLSTIIYRFRIMNVHCLYKQTETLENTRTNIRTKLRKIRSGVSPPPWLKVLATWLDAGLIHCWAWLARDHLTNLQARLASRARTAVMVNTDSTRSQSAPKNLSQRRTFKISILQIAKRADWGWQDVMNFEFEFHYILIQFNILTQFNILIHFDTYK